MLVSVSPITAFLVGLVIGFVLGAAFGIWLGKSIGYKPTLGKYLLAAGTIGLVGAVGFAGWHYWEVGQLPSLARLLKPLGDEYSQTVRNCFSTASALALGLVSCLGLAIPAGREMQRIETEMREAEQKARAEAEARAALTRRLPLKFRVRKSEGVLSDSVYITYLGCDSDRSSALSKVAVGVAVDGLWFSVVSIRCHTGMLPSTLQPSAEVEINFRKKAGISSVKLHGTAMLNGVEKPISQRFSFSSATYNEDGGLVEE